MLLASLLGDNPNRSFTYDELKKLLKTYSNSSVYMMIYRLSNAGMEIEVKNKSIMYRRDKNDDTNI